MWRGFVVTVAVIMVLFLLVPGVPAQEGTPATPAACQPATPCADSKSSTGLASSGIGFQAAGSGESAASETPAAAGFGLATAVMVLLALALIYALGGAMLVAVGRTAPALPAGAGVLIPVLSVIGLGVAIYLTYVETRSVAAVCGPVGDCNSVQSSAFARLFGVLPVGLLGAIGYVAILAAWITQRFGKGRSAALGGLALFGLALFGVLFSLYLTYLELFVIRAVCIWCLTSAVIMALLLVLSVRPAAEVVAPE